MLSNDLEKLRLDALSALEIFDTEPEPAFDQLTQLASSLYNVPIALISLVDKQRQWFKSCIGLGVNSTSRDVAFCDIAIRSDEVMIVRDATKDPRFCLNPLVTGDPHIRFYAGAPIRHQDILIGTLCIIDRKPRPDFDFEAARTLQQLAATVSSLLVMRKDAILNQAVLKQRADIQRKLEMMEEVAGVGYWHVDLETEQVTWSKGVYDIHGADRVEYNPDLISAIDWYHPDDRAEVAEWLSSSVATGEVSEFELRIVRTDGEVRNVHCRGAVSMGPEGNPISVFGVFTDITDRLKTSRRLEASEARYRLLAERSNDIIAVYDISGRFEYISPSVRTVLGYEQHEIIGKAVNDIIYVEDLPATLGAFHNYVVTKDWSRAFRVQYRARHADGHLVWLEAHPRPVLDATNTRIVNFQDVVRDISAQVVAQQEIMASEARYKVLANNANDLVLQCQMDGKVLYASPSAERITGYANSQLIGKKWCDLLEADDASQVISAIQSLVTSKAMPAREPLEYRFRHASGQEIWLEGRPTLVFDETTGKPEGFITIIRDITPRKTALSELKSALVAAEAATEAKSQFLSTMTHEIRTPLTTILGYANLLSDTQDLPDESQTFANRIGKAGRTLLGLVNDILTVSKLEAGQVKLKPKATHLRELVHDLVEQFQAPANLAGIELSFDYDDELPEWLLIDDTRISQVLNNLIGNACKFTEQGSISVKLRALLRDAGTFLRLEVSDTGPGLTEDQISQLFQRFHQIDRGIDRKHGGTGLGLAICSEIAMLMNGRIGIESKPGIGSTFWLEVPMIQVPGSEDIALELQSSVPLIQSCKILLVDDHAINRQMIRSLVSTYGVEVFEAADGEEAISECDARPFDLILMDIQMPKLDGISATKAIRSHSHVNSRTPIVALTAMSPSQLESDFTTSLFTEILTKPVDPKELHRVIKSLTSEDAPKIKLRSVQ